MNPRHVVDGLIDLHKPTAKVNRYQQSIKVGLASVFAAGTFFIGALALDDTVPATTKEQVPTDSTKDSCEKHLFQAISRETGKLAMLPYTGETPSTEQVVKLYMRSSSLQLEAAHFPIIMMAPVVILEDC